MLSNNKRKALVVGINKYNCFKNLQAPAVNATFIENNFKTLCQFQVTRLENVTRKQIKNAIINLLMPSGEHADTVILYFSGYVIAKKEGVSELFFTTSESNPSQDDLGLSLQWLKQILKESPVTNQIIIFDCCYHQKKQLDLDKFIAGNENDKNRLFIVSFHSYNKSFREKYHKDTKLSKCTELTAAILNILQSKSKESIDNKRLVKQLKEYEKQLNICGDFKRISFGKTIYFIPGEDKYTQENKSEPSDSPYKGLAYFNYSEADAEYFYGRNTLTDELLEKVNKNNFLALLGASGSGKSSIIRAGIVYQLQQGLRISGSENWYIPQVFQPGKEPLNNLARAFVDTKLPEDEQNIQFKEFRELLNQEDQGLKQLINKVISTNVERVVLIVDQFEEVFSLRDNPDEPLAKDSEQYKFIQCLLKDLNDLGDKFCLVLAIRADFFGKCAEEEYFGLARKIQQHLVAVTPMSEEDLEEVIVQPAKKLGVKVDDALKRQLITDAKEVSGSLPLLQNALTELWKRRNHQELTLTYSLYEEIKNEIKKQLVDNRGFLEALLEKHLEHVYNSLNKRKTEIANYILVNLIEIGNGTGSTRIRVYRKNLAESAQYSLDEIRAVINHLTSNNIIIISEEIQNDGFKDEVVTLAHEILIIHWKTLRELLDKKRVYRPFKAAIELDTKKWTIEKKSGNQNIESFLYTGEKLKEAEKIIENFGYLLQLTGEEKEFIQESKANQVSEEQKKHKIRQQRFTALRILIISLLLILFLLSLLFVSEKEKNTQAERFQLNQSVALTRYSDALFREGQKFDALVEGLRAAIPLQKLKLDTPMKDETVSVLRRTVFGAKERNRLEKHIGSVYSVSFNLDGKILASGGADGTIRIWDVTTGKEINTFKGHSGKVYSVSFNLDGTILASGGADGTIRLWNVTTGEEINTFKGHNGKVYSISFNSDGKTLASGSTDGTVRIWNINTHNNSILSKDNYFVHSVSFSRDGKILASGSADGTIRLWSANDTAKLWDANTRESSILNRHEYSVNSVSFNKDGTKLVSGNFDNTIKLWDVATGKKITTVTGHRDWILDVSFSPDDKILASAAADGSIKIWDASRIEENTTFTGHSDWVSSVSFNPKNETKLASGSLDSTIKIWDIATGKEERTIYTVEGNNSDSRQRKINSISYSHNGKILASSSADGFIQLWDASTGQEIDSKFVGNNTWINNIIFSFDDKKIAFATLNHTVQIWDLETDKLIRIFKESDGFSGVSFSPDDNLLASGSFDNTIKIWDIITGKLVKALQGHTSKVNTVSFSPDGKTLASGSFNNIIKLWDVEEGKLIKTLKGHSGKINSLSFSPNGKFLASSSADKTIKIWDIILGKDIKTFTEHIEDILSVTFSPDGKTLASGSADEKVMLWKVPDNNNFIAANDNLDLNELIKLGCDWAGGYLQYNSNVRIHDQHLCDNINTAK